MYILLCCFFFVIFADIFMGLTKTISGRYLFYETEKKPCFTLFCKFSLSLSFILWKETVSKRCLSFYFSVDETKEMLIKL